MVRWGKMLSDKMHWRKIISTWGKSSGVTVADIDAATRIVETAS